MALGLSGDRFARPPLTVRPVGSTRRISTPVQIAVTGAAAVGVAVLPPTLSIAAIVGLAAFLVFVSQPLLGVYALLFSVPFQSIRNLQAGSLNVTVTEVLVFCLVLAWGGRAITEGRFNSGYLPWLGPLLLYGAVLGLSLTQATDFAGSFKELLKWAELLFAYVVGMSVIGSRKDLRRLLIATFAAVVAEALVGFGQTVLHAGPSSFARGGFLRAAGTFEQPNPFAGYLNMCLPMAVTLLAYRAFPRRPMWLVVAICGGGVLISESRGGLLASIGALLVISVVALPRSRALIGLGGIVLLGVLAGGAIGLVPSQVTEPLAAQFGVANIDVANPSPANWAVAERLAHVQAGLSMWADHPVLGVGIGNYPKQYPHYKVITTGDIWGNALGHAHNYYINIGAEAGIIGLVALVILLAGGVVICARAYSRATAPLERAVALGGLGVMVTIVIHNMFDDIFVHGMEVQMALVLVAASRVAVGFRPEQEVERVG